MSTTQGYTTTTNIWSCNIYTLIGYMQTPNKEMCDRPDLMKITDDWKSVIEDQDFTRHADCFTIFTRLVLPHSLLQILPGRQYSMQKVFLESIHYKISEYMMMEYNIRWSFIIYISQQKVDFQEPEILSQKWMRIYGSSSIAFIPGLQKSLLELEQRLHCIFRNLGQAELYAHKLRNYLINEDWHVLISNIDGSLGVFCSQEPLVFLKCQRKRRSYNGLKPLNIPCNQ